MICHSTRLDHLYDINSAKKAESVEFDEIYPITDGFIQSSQLPKARPHMKELQNSAKVSPDQAIRLSREEVNARINEFKKSASSHSLKSEDDHQTPSEEMKHSENHPATDKSAEVTNQIVAILEKENFGMGGKKLKIENIINKNTKEKIHFSEEQQIKIQIALLKSDGVNAKDESSKSDILNKLKAFGAINQKNTSNTKHKIPSTHQKTNGIADRITRFNR